MINLPINQRLTAIVPRTYCLRGSKRTVPTVKVVFGSLSVFRSPILAMARPRACVALGKTKTTEAVSSLEANNSETNPQGTTMINFSRWIKMNAPIKNSLLSASSKQMGRIEKHSHTTSEMSPTTRITERFLECQVVSPGCGTYRKESSDTSLLPGRPSCLPPQPMESTINR